MIMTYFRWIISHLSHMFPQELSQPASHLFPWIVPAWISSIPMHFPSQLSQSTCHLYPCSMNCPHMYLFLPHKLSPFVPSLSSWIVPNLHLVVPMNLSICSLCFPMDCPHMHLIFPNELFPLLPYLSQWIVPTWTSIDRLSYCRLFCQLTTLCFLLSPN